MNKNFSCIIPFYNEGESLLSIIKVFSTIPSIQQIICVDDGSTNNLCELVKKTFPKVTLIKLPHNQGKSTAVFAGLARAKCENLLLFDSDCHFIKKEEITRALDKFNASKLDMLILKTRGLNGIIDHFLQKYIFLSGNRILKKIDLLAIQKKNPKKYQLEVAINNYMLEYDKKVGWMDSSIYNPHKVTKIGLLKGISKEIQMEIDIFSYIGLFDYVKQLHSISKKERKTS